MSRTLESPVDVELLISEYNPFKALWSCGFGKSSLQKYDGSEQGQRLERRRA
jgi:hypothetical protein